MSHRTEGVEPASLWLDKAAIAAVQNAYGAAIDERDWPALRECFAGDARVTFGRPSRLGTLDEFIDWAPRYHDQLGPTVHQITTHRAAVQGARAQARCCLHAVLVEPSLEKALSVFGVYDDELVRTGNDWRIQSRRFTPVWRHTHAVATAPPA